MVDIYLAPKHGFRCWWRSYHLAATDRTLDNGWLNQPATAMSEILSSFQGLSVGFHVPPSSQQTVMENALSEPTTPTFYSVGFISSPGADLPLPLVPL